MIPFDFSYIRPDTLKDAHQAFTELFSQGKTPMYYAGGSEIITMSRVGSIRPDAVIDIKRIPECMKLYKDESGLYIGSAVTLNQITESKLFPLLEKASGRIADHTNRCRITLGGNLCGTIIYRETSLPLLISDAKITLFGKNGLVTHDFRSVFNGRLIKNPDEIVVSVFIPSHALDSTYFHIKRTAHEKIDYPIVTLCANIIDNKLRISFSGICSHPFRSTEIENVLNDTSLSISEKTEKAAELLPEPPYSDVEASGEYRLYVFKNMLSSLLEEL